MTFIQDIISEFNSSLFVVLNFIAYYVLYIYEREVFCYKDILDFFLR